MLRAAKAALRRPSSAVFSAVSTLILLVIRALLCLISERDKFLLAAALCIEAKRAFSASLSLSVSIVKFLIAVLATVAAP